MVFSINDFGKLLNIVVRKIIRECNGKFIELEKRVGRNKKERQKERKRKINEGVVECVIYFLRNY